MTLQTDLERARLAADVLRNDVFIEAWRLMDEEIIAQWRSATDEKTRERLHLQQKCLSRLRQSLESVMASGQVAAKTLELEQRRSLGQMFRPGSGR